MKFAVLVALALALALTGFVLVVIGNVISQVI